MKLYRNWQDFKDTAQGSCIAIGNFDGVHRGHQYILSTMLSEAAKDQLLSTALSFYPHPAEFHRPDVKFLHITTEEQKLREIENLGVEAVVILPYSKKLASMGAEEFCVEVLVQGLHVKKVIVGEDFTFGKGREGNVDTLKELAQKYDFTVIVPEDHGMPLEEESAKRFSSTWLREVLSQGDVAQAAKILGRYHVVEGEVVHGAARGRELGFPTANLSLESHGLVPADGVYAGWLHVDRERYPVAISVGTNPTFKGVKERQVEAHVINRPEENVEDFDLYGKHAQVEFVEYLRGMVAYTGVEDLIKQMHQDIAQTERILHEN